MHPHIQLRAFVAGITAGILFLALTMLVFLFVYNNKIIPNVYIEHINVGGMTKEEAKALVDQNTTQEWTITAVSEDRSILIASSSAQVGVFADTSTAVENAFRVGRETNFITNIATLFSSLTDKTHVSIPIMSSSLITQQWIQDIAPSMYLPKDFPTVTLTTSGKASSLKIHEGNSGRELNTKELFAIVEKLEKPQEGEILLPIASTSAKLTEEQIHVVRTRAETYVGKIIELTGEADAHATIHDQILISFLSLPDGYNSAAISTHIATVAAQIDRLPRNAELTIVDEKVTHFVAPEKGRQINTEALLRQIESTLHLLETSDTKSHTIVLDMATTEPEITLEKTNTLGIHERIGMAESLFFHSIVNRVHNVELTASKIQNTLVKPGEEFSFNKTVGDISAKTGYKQAYVISGGRTILGDGGGVCQVSTTMFRSAMNAGLPITERHGHSYRVGYYEQNSKPGIDATVYAPSVDLRFKNDTPGYLLITTQVWPKEYRMNISIWGTSDGRVSKVFDEKLWDQVAPKPTIYQDDPSLPPGKLKQVDWATWGAKTSFKYYVERPKENGEMEVLQDRVFKTTYQSWADVYLRGIQL